MELDNLDQDQLQTFVANSGCSADFNYWVKVRKFLVQPLSAPGSVLDIGCANGLLLHCLKKWSGIPLALFGIEKNSARLHSVDSSRLLPEEYSLGNLRCATLDDFLDGKLNDFPVVFNYIYWNVWTEVDFSRADHFSRVERLFRHVGSAGSLVLAFYDGREYNLKRENLIRQHFDGDILITSLHCDGGPHTALVLTKRL